MPFFYCMTSLHLFCSLAVLGGSFIIISFFSCLPASHLMARCSSSHIFAFVDSILVSELKSQLWHWADAYPGLNFNLYVKMFLSSIEFVWKNTLHFQKCTVSFIGLSCILLEPAVWGGKFVVQIQYWGYREPILCSWNGKSEDISVCIMFSISWV